MSTRVKELKDGERKTKLRTASGILSPDQLLTTSDLMQFLQIKHRKTIYHLIKSGLPKIMVGRRFRFIKEEILEFLRSKSRSG